MIITPKHMGVVKMENKDKWESFFKALRIYLDETDLSKYTFISDIHKVYLYASYFFLYMISTFNLFLLNLLFCIGFH